MEKVHLSKLIVHALKLHSKAKRSYRKGVLSLEEFSNELKRILALLGEVTDVHGDSEEIDNAKLAIWFTIESYDKDAIL